MATFSKLLAYKVAENINISGTTFVMAGKREIIAAFSNGIENGGGRPHSIP